MLKIILLSTLLLTTIIAFSQTLNPRREIQILLNNIQQNLANSRINESELLKARDQLILADKILSGQTVPNEQSKQLVCTSRDNDNIDPFVLAFSKPDFSIEKISNTILKKGDCRDSAMKSIDLGNFVFTCISKDNDGVAPFTLALINKKDSLIVKINLFKQMSDCHSSLSRVRSNTFAIQFCASKDNDGVSTFTKFSYTPSEQKLNQSTENYSSLQECLDFN